MFPSTRASELLTPNWFYLIIFFVYFQHYPPPRYNRLNVSQNIIYSWKYSFLHLLTEIFFSAQLTLLFFLPLLNHPNQPSIVQFRSITRWRSHFSFNILNLLINISLKKLRLYYMRVHSWSNKTNDINLNLNNARRHCQFIVTIWLWRGIH